MSHLALLLLLPFLACAKETAPLGVEVPALVFEATGGTDSVHKEAVAFVRQRLQLGGFDKLRVEREGGVILVERPAGAWAIKRVKRLIEFGGSSLEMRITVEPDAPNYDEYWKRFVKSGHKELQLPAKSLPEAERTKYPHGLRWVPLSGRADADPWKVRLPGDAEPWILCRLDDCKITEKSLENVSCRLDVVFGIAPSWIVVFDVREKHRENMARLTATKNEYLAIIVNGEVHSAPVLRDAPLTDRAQISGNFSEQEARALALLLARDALPVRLLYRNMLVPR